MSVLRRVLAVAETAAVALTFTALLLGTMVGLVSVPGVTAALIRANRTWIYTGLAPDTTVMLADGVRGWVTSYPDDVPSAARRAMKSFAADEVAHLTDVRAVMNAARLATGIAAALLAAWLVACLVFRRWLPLRRGFAAGGLTSVALVAVVAVASIWDFSSAFSAFHGLFFKAGTWEFPAESLLIRVFPGPFWESAGALWGALVAVAGAALFIASRLLPRDDAEAQTISEKRRKRDRTGMVEQEPDDGSTDDAGHSGGVTPS